MIRIFKRLKGMKTGKLLSRFETNSLIDVSNPTNKEIKEIEEKFKIPQTDIGFFLDRDEPARISNEEYGTVIILKVVLDRGKNKKMKLTTLTIIIRKDSVVLIHKDQIKFIDDLIEHVEKGFYTDKKIRTLLIILKKLTSDFIQKTKKLQMLTEEVEKDLLKTFKVEEFIKYTTIRSSLIYLNEGIIENSKVLESILRGKKKYIKIFKSDRELLEDIVIDNRQLVRSISVLMQATVSTMDGYASLVSLNLERIMKRLTDLTVILSVFVGIASFYGMNVALPLQHNPYAFYFIIGTAFSISILVLFFLKIKGWYG